MNDSSINWWDEWADRPLRSRPSRRQREISGTWSLVRSSVGWDTLVSAIICLDVVTMSGDYHPPPCVSTTLEQAGAHNPLYFNGNATMRSIDRSVQTYLSSLPPRSGSLPACEISLSALHELPGLSSRFRMPIARAARKYGLDPALVMAVVHTESRFNPEAQSGVGAEGLMQLMPKTAKAMGVANRMNAVESLDGGSKYLAKLLSIYDGDVALALAAYNAGMGQVARYHGIPPIKETQSYVANVMALWPAYREARLAATDVAENSGSGH